ELLAGARLAGDEHGDLAVRGLAQPAVHRADRLRAADQAVELLVLAELVVELLDLALGALERRCELALALLEGAPDLLDPRDVLERSGDAIRAPRAIADDRGADLDPAQPAVGADHARGQIDRRGVEAAHRRIDAIAVVGMQPGAPGLALGVHRCDRPPGQRLEAGADIEQLARRPLRQPERLLRGLGDLAQLLLAP